jgi:hypothetical protein
LHDVTVTQRLHHPSHVLRVLDEAPPFVDAADERFHLLAHRRPFFTFTGTG